MAESNQAVESRLILDCARIYTQAIQRSELHSLSTSELDWQKVLTLADHHSFRPLLAHILTDPCLSENVPQSVRTTLKMTLYGCVRNHEDYREWLVGVIDLLQHGGVFPMLLKGAALADRIYPKAHLRPSVDLDLLVRVEDLVKAGAILKQHGYMLTSPLPTSSDLDGLDLSSLVQSDAKVASPDRSELHDQHLAFGKMESNTVRLVELHWRPSPRWLGDLDVDAIWRQVGHMSIEGREVLVPSNEFQVVLLVLHLIQHGWGERSLRNYLDLALVLKGATTLDWQLICNTIKQLRCRGYAYYVLLWVYTELGAPVPESALTDLMPGVYESWHSRPPRRFSEIVSLSDDYRIKDKLACLRDEVLKQPRVRDKLILLVGAAFPPILTLAMRMGTMPRWQLYFSCWARPVLVLWRAAFRRKRRAGRALGRGSALKQVTFESEHEV